MKKATATKHQSTSSGKKALLFTIAAILIILLLFLLFNLIVYFLERNQSLVRRQNELAGSSLFGNTADSFLSGVDYLSTGGSSSNLRSTDGTDNNGSTYSNRDSSNTTTTTDSSSQPTAYQPMIIFVPQSTTGQNGQPGSNSQQTTIVNPGVNPTSEQDNAQTYSGRDDSTTDTINRRFSTTLLRDINLDPSLSPNLNADVLDNVPLPQNIDTQVLPDNPLYLAIDTSNTFRNFFTFDSYGKTLNYLELANGKMIQGIILLNRDSKENTEQIAINTFYEANTLMLLADKQMQHNLDVNVQVARELSASLFRSIALQQVLLLAAENIGNISVSNQIEDIRIDHLANAGIILQDLASVSDMHLNALSALINANIATPIQTLQTIALVNDLENTTTLTSTITPVKDTLTTVLVGQLIKLPKDQQVKTLLTFIGKEPIRTVRMLETLDLIDRSEINQVKQEVTQTSLASLEQTIKALPDAQRLGLIDHMAGKTFEQLRHLYILENILAKADNPAELAQTSWLVGEAKKKTVAYITDEIKNHQLSLEKDPFIRNALTNPDKYALSALKDIEQEEQQQISQNPQAQKVLEKVREASVNQYANDLTTTVQNNKPSASVNNAKAFIKDQVQDMPKETQQIVNQKLQNLPSANVQVNLQNSVQQPTNQNAQSENTLQNNGTAPVTNIAPNQTLPSIH